MCTIPFVNVRPFTLKFGTPIVTPAALVLLTVKLPTEWALYKLLPFKLYSFAKYVPEPEIVWGIAEGAKAPLMIFPKYKFPPRGIFKVPLFIIFPPT